MSRDGAARTSTPASQTLSRGLTILELLAAAGSALAIDDVAAKLGVHRSVAYRLVRTLEQHRLVDRDPAGRIQLAAGLAALGAAVNRDLQAVAAGALTGAANELGMTCFLVVEDRGECITLLSVTPVRAVASVAQRPGARHPVTVGAPGRAILAILPEPEWPAAVPASVRDLVDEVRSRGYATSEDEVLRNVRAAAVPLPVPGHRPMAVAAMHVAAGGTPDAEIAARLQQAVGAISAQLGG